MPTSESFQQLALRFIDPVQYDYEVIRGVLLADETLAERSQLTGVDRDTIGEKTRRFLQQGMFGLVDQRTTSDKGRHRYPDVVAATILYLKQLYPPIHYREIVRIVERKFGYKTNHHTVKAFLEHSQIPVQLPLPLMRFHQFDDAYRARFTVVRMHYEGWHQQSIANCLGLSRKHVWHILSAFKQDEFAALEDQRRRPANHPDNQLSLPFMEEIREVQEEYPRAGRFRVRGIVAQRTGKTPSEATIGRAMAKNRRHHQAPPAWSTDRQQEDPTAALMKQLLYEPTYRHRYWYVDFRYLVRIGEDRHWVYSLLILEGYSRKILGGMATEHQDTVAVLQLLTSVIREYGLPAGMVSDNGSPFTSDAYEGMLKTLGIEVCHIEKGKPWQNLIEAQFKVELRLADAHFERAVDLEEIQDRHAAFIGLFNTTPHWAHRERKDGQQTPVEVLTWIRGREVAPEVVERALRHRQLERVVTLRGYVSVQRFYLYAERGLSRRRVSIWLTEGRLHIAYQETLLAHYATRYDRKARRLRAVDTPRLFPTVYTSPQLEFWELDDEQWRKIAPRPYDHHPVPMPRASRQLALPASGE